MTALCSAAPISRYIQISVKVVRIMDKCKSHPYKVGVTDGLTDPQQNVARFPHPPSPTGTGWNKLVLHNHLDSQLLTHKGIRISTCNPNHPQAGTTAQLDFLCTKIQAQKSKTGAIGHFFVTLDKKWPIWSIFFDVFRISEKIHTKFGE